MSIDTTDLVDLTTVRTFLDAEKALIENVEKKIKKLKVKCFYIGKTYIAKFQSYAGTMRPETWGMAGLQGRQRVHQNEDYGKSGMTVLAVVDYDCANVEAATDVGKLCSRYKIDLENYTLALEQRLIHQYKAIEPNDNCANTTVTTGNLKETTSGTVAYVLYMAYTS